MMILPLRWCHSRWARRWIAPVVLRPRMLHAALLLAAASLHSSPSCSAATNAGTDAAQNLRADAATNLRADTATSPLSVRDQLNQDRTETIEPYLYGLAIAGAICAWKFRQKRRVEQVLA
jgi:hypothetical protein